MLRFLNLFNPYHLSAKVRAKEPLPIQREIILQFLLLGVALWSVIAVVIFLVQTGVSAQNLTLALPFFISIAILLFLTLVRRLPFPVRAGGLILLLLTEMVEAMLREGVTGPAAIYSVGVSACVAVLFSARSGFFTVIGMMVLHFTFAWAMISGRISLPDPGNLPSSAVLADWFSSGMAVLLVSSSFTGAFFQLTRGLAGALNDQKKLITELAIERDMLEIRVAERTEELSRKASQLEASRQVSATLAKITETRELLTTAVDVIKARFGFYHVEIFLNDRDDRYAVLEASTGDAGMKMLENHHRLRIGEIGIVGYVASHGHPRVTADVLLDPSYSPNPLLPDTRAEMAVPMFSAGKVIGVLGVQSTQPGAFLQDDIDIIAAIAAQLSLALEKARLLQELQNNLTEMETSVRQKTAGDWNSHLVGTLGRHHVAYQYKQAQVLPAPETHSPQSLQALQLGKTIITPAESADHPETIMVVPILLRNQPLGVIHLRIAGSDASPELIELVEKAVTRLSMSLENVRLLEELQHRAERERLVGEIGAKVRGSTDVESILRTAASELGRSLGVSEVIVQLATGK